jgi:NTP pyrophosphatase (non-canonical NTP hydrolase)
MKTKPDEAAETVTYEKLAIRTESNNWTGIAGRLMSFVENEVVPDRIILRLLHAGLGLATEAGEFLDVMKKHVFYGADIDRENLIEELGDVMLYIAIAAYALGIDFAEIQSKNLAKLWKRYPEKFTDEHAANRDTSAERDAMTTATVPWSEGSR